MFLHLMKFRCIDQVFPLGNPQITDLRSCSPDAARKRRLIINHSPKDGSMLFLHGPSFENAHGLTRIVSGPGYVLDAKRICLILATSVKSVRWNGAKRTRQLLDSRGQWADPFNSQKREVPYALPGPFLRSVPGGDVSHFVRYYSCQFCLAMRLKNERAC